MAMFENFPYTNLHELNLDWLIEQLNIIKESTVISVNGQTGTVVLYQNATVQFPDVPEDAWSIIRMADGTQRGILFGNDDKAYIVHGNLMAQIYSQNNPPAYPVTSVNGQTGDVVLYSSQYVQLPTLTDAQITNWTIFRTVNNVARGIQFDDDGSAYIIDGTNRYMIYTQNNPPPIPVTSVNGKTGTVVLFNDANGVVTYPVFNNENYDGWILTRTVNGTNLGLAFKEDGTLIFKVGNNEYGVYTTNDMPADIVDDRSDDVLQISTDATSAIWGLLRTTSEGNIGLLFNDTDPDDPEVYLAYTDSNDQEQTLQLLTPNQIPASGVISVNAKTGIVVLTGEDIATSTSNSNKLDVTFANVEGTVAVVETTNTAVNNISVGQYVIWKDQLYKCTNAIVSGDTLSLSNLAYANTTAFDEIVKIINQLSNLKFAEITGLTISTSKNYHVEDGSRHMIILLSGGGTTYDGLYLINCTGSGQVTLIEIYNGSHITHSTSTNTLTLTGTGSGTTGIALYDICLHGDVMS